MRREYCRYQERGKQVIHATTQMVFGEKVGGCITFKSEVRNGDAVLLVGTQQQRRRHIMS